jgi:HAD superfamily hydrolase (TIGR01509 family)
MDEKGLGRRLQEARQAAGLTQQQLCQKAGLSYSTLAKIERGAIKAPSIFTIGQIAAVLGTSLDALVGSPAPPAPKIEKKRSKSGVTFVFFDVNGCLVRFFHRAFTRLSEETGTPADIIETTFWHFNDAVCRGEMSLEDFNREIAKQLHRDNLDWLNYYLEAIDPIPEMHELLRWAADMYDTGLLTNIMPGFLNAMKERGLIPDVAYTTVIDSSEVGAIKPDPKIYEAAMTAVKRPPAEILLVDDSRANVMAAERLGWHVLWFDDYRPDESVARIRTALEVAESPPTP